MKIENYRGFELILGVCAAFPTVFCAFRPSGDQKALPNHKNPLKTRHRPDLLADENAADDNMTDMSCRCHATDWIGRVIGCSPE
jgi:hypothetical protein